MTENVLSAINTAMSDIGIEYGFITYQKNPIVYPYFSGEYNEIEGSTEDGLQESTFILTGFSRGQGAWLALENAKEAIENYFTREGTVFSFDDGSKAVIMYSYAFPVPKEDADLKSIQINLTIKEWKVI